MKAKELKIGDKFWMRESGLGLFCIKDEERGYIYINGDEIQAIVVRTSSGDVISISEESDVDLYTHQPCSVCGSVNCGGNHCPYCGEIECYDNCRDKYCDRCGNLNEYCSCYDDPLACERNEHLVSVPELIEMEEVNDD